MCFYRVCFLNRRCFYFTIPMHFNNILVMNYRACTFAYLLIHYHVKIFAKELKENIFKCIFNWFQSKNSITILLKLLTKKVVHVLFWDNVMCTCSIEYLKSEWTISGGPFSYFCWNVTLYSDTVCQSSVIWLVAIKGCDFVENSFFFFSIFLLFIVNHIS